MLFIVNSFPFSWFKEGIKIESVKHLNIDELTNLILSEGHVSRIDELSSNVLTLFTSIAIGQRHGELRPLKANDYIVIFSPNERILHTFKVV